MGLLCFCHVTLKGQKPPPRGYPAGPSTIGEHVRKRRLDLGLSFKDAGERLGVHFTTVMSWELRDRKPGPRFMPAVIRFLGYNPLPPGETLGQKLIAHRKAHGMTRLMFAADLGVHPGTLWRWETDRAKPRRPLPAVIFAGGSMPYGDASQAGSPRRRAKRS